ncbi:MAG: hypothetical protein H6608_02235 [Flavobacteriales bacterium]|nr:hypothetical protein [Flavobacteriales bacterium]
MVQQANDLVDGHQIRLDLIDSVRDNSIELQSPEQTRQATDVYIFTVNRIQKNINNDPNLKALDKKRLLTDLAGVLAEYDRSNYYLFSATALRFTMITRIQEVVDQRRIKAILNSDIVTALQVIPFFDHKPYAPDVLKHAAAIEPSLLLSKFGEFAFHRYAAEVLEAICSRAPMHVSYYMGTNNSVFQVMSTLDENGYPAIQAMMQIYRKVGSNSRVYLLLDRLMDNRILFSQAREMVKDRDSLFRYLIDVRKKSDVFAEHSIDVELQYTSSRRIRYINDLHEEDDDVRFRIIDSIPLPSEELYTMLVYGEDEVFTSSFLGIFNRLMKRMRSPGSYEFLHSVGMNRYRTFIRMCAGYNTLPQFLGKMSAWEKRSLFNRIVGGLGQEDNPLQEAVAVADIYGSLTSAEDREIFSAALKKEYETQQRTDPGVNILYQTLLQLLGISGNNPDLQEDVSALSGLSNASLFRKDGHIQQHFFFDDDDGHASFASFLSSFSGKPGWTIVDQKTYVIVQSIGGKFIRLFANKPTAEYAGQDAIRMYFQTHGHFPDVVVHRGHSYYVSTAIESLTPNAGLVILGSCGGYNNISRVLAYSPNAQIISSKQVGTMVVNNALIFTICEDLRSGKNIQWDNVWKAVNTSIKWNKTAVERFADYQEPHKNLGAILIRMYRKSL